MILLGNRLLAAVNKTKATPVVQSFSTKQSNGIALTVTAPSGVAVGDLLLAFGSSETATSAFTAPSGWTKPVDDTNLPDIMVAYRIATGTDAYDFTHASNSRHTITVLRISGGAYDSVSSVSTAASAGSVTAATLTAAAQNSLAIACFTCTPAAITFGTPSGWTSVTSYNSFAPSQHIFSKNCTGASGNAVVDPSGTSGTSGAIMIMVKPS